MAIDFNQNELNTILTNLRTNGFNTELITVNKSELEYDEENDLVNCVIKLSESKSYNDYSAAILYKRVDPDDEVPVYVGLPVPSVFPLQTGEIEINNIEYALMDAGKGKMVLKIFSKSANYQIEDIIDYMFDKDVFYILLLKSVNYLNLRSENTFAYSSLEDFLNLVSKDTFQYILTMLEGKTKMFFLSESELYPGFVYEIYHSALPDETQGCVPLPGLNIYLKKSKLKTFSEINASEFIAFNQKQLVGYNKKDYEKQLPENLKNAASNNSAVLNELFKNDNNGDYLHDDVLKKIIFEEDKIYPVVGEIHLGSNLLLEGNNSTLKIESDLTNGIDLFYDECNNALDTYNVEIRNMNLIGRCKAVVNAPKYATEKKDQAFHYFREHKNSHITLYNVNASNFVYVLHLGGASTPEYWRIKNCRFTKTGNAILISETKNFVVSESTIDNSLSLDVRDHCIYISKGCSYITVDRCILKNSIGAAIHQRYEYVKEDLSCDYSPECTTLHTIYTNLKIENCRVAIRIAYFARDVYISGIYAENVEKAIHLACCTGVTIKKMTAVTLSGEKTTFQKDENTPKSISDIATSVFTISDAVTARISDCVFKNFPSVSVPECYIEITDFNSYDLLSKFPQWFDNGALLDKISVENCKFVSDNYSTSALGINNQENRLCKYNMNFEDCEFYYASDNTSPIKIFYAYGNESSPSEFVFDNCKINFFVKTACPETPNKYTFIKENVGETVEINNVTIKSKYSA